MLNVDRDVLACGAGAGIGVIIPEVLLKYVEPTYGATIPGTEFIPTPWNRWSILLPIASGIPCLLAGLFWRSNYSSFLFGYGVASTANGIIRGVFDMPSSSARARTRSPVRPLGRIRPRVRQQEPPLMMGVHPTGRGSKQHMSKVHETETGISEKVIVA